MPPLKAQLLLEESLSAYFPEMVFTDSGITVQLHRNTHAIPGGMSRAGFYEDAFDERLVSLIRKFNNQNKIIASVCVGALAIAKSGALHGRMGTTYHLSSKRQTQLSDMGVNVIQRPIVVDANIITSQSPATAINVAFTLIEKLTSRANVEKIKEGMGFPLL